MKVFEEFREGAGYVLYHGNGAQPHECYRRSMGEDALARDAAGGVEGVGRRTAAHSSDLLDYATAVPHLGCLMRRIALAVVLVALLPLIPERQASVGAATADRLGPWTLAA